MGFKCGIVDLPNVGKSALFNTLTKAGIGAVNFPFCTIELDTGVVPMPDPRLDKLAETVRPQHILPTTMEFVDIMDLVKDASKDEGPGNQFLTNICETEAIDHMVRCFESDDIIHVNNKMGPADDIGVISTEPTLSNLNTCERAIYHMQEKAEGSDEDAGAELAALEECLPQLESTGMLHSLKNLTDEDKAATKYLSFLTLKPTVYIANVSGDGFEDNPYLDKVRGIAAAEGSVVVAVCAAVESDIAELDNTNRGEFVAELGLEKPSLNRVIHAGYELLSLQTYSIAGVKEVHVWTIPVGATVPQTAGKIHTNFEKGFIRAQTIAYGNFITYGGEQGAREAGRIRIEGEDYIVKSGDVVNFLFGV